MLLTDKFKWGNLALVLTTLGCSVTTPSRIYRPKSECSHEPYPGKYRPARGIGMVEKIWVHSHVWRDVVEVMVDMALSLLRE